MTGSGRFEIERGSELYPISLEDLPDPPRRLYVVGDPRVLARESMSIIGTRRASPYGIAVAELAARCAVDAGLAVVSGGAMGCDHAAGRECIDRGGTHIVVLGTGADVAYPQSSTLLIEDAVERGGAVVSIERWGSPPRKYVFPKRNRIIAALSRSLLIAEAGMPSGTFSTAEVAESIGREVLVAPGSMFSPESKGSNYLISVGASCMADEEAIETAISRIYGTLRRQHGGFEGSLPGGDDHERAILKALTASPLKIGELMRVTRLDSRSCLELLGELTASGFVERGYDGSYAATPKTLHAQTSFGHNTKA